MLTLLGTSTSTCHIKLNIGNVMADSHLYEYVYDVM